MRLSDLITAAQAAKLLGLSKERVCQLCKQGRIAATKPGRDWIMWRQSVEAFAKIERPDGRPPENNSENSRFCCQVSIDHAE